MRRLGDLLAGTYVVRDRVPEPAMRLMMLVLAATCHLHDLCIGGLDLLDDPHGLQLA